MKLQVEASKRLEDGMHKGVIKHLQMEERGQEKKFKYLDVYIKAENGSVQRVGYPANITPDTALGKLLARFGAVLKVGEELDIEATLKSRTCQFQTTTDAKGYSNVLPETVKPDANK